MSFKNQLHTIQERNALLGSPKVRFMVIAPIFVMKSVDYLLQSLAVDTGWF